MEYVFIRAWRRQCGWTQNDLAKAAAMPLSTIGEIETRHKNPKMAELKKIANAFGITVEELYKEP